MIDFGLVASLIVAIGLPALLADRWRDTGEPGSSFLDDVIGPLAAGVVAGRLVTLSLDDPTSIGSLSDMAVIRSGVEFWPGALAAAGVVAWQAKRAGVSPMRRWAEFAPLAVLGYAAYEATCVFRDGCLGPVSGIGLRPPGVQSTMLPIGWFMAAGALIGAVLVHRLQRSARPVVVVAVAVGLVAAVRSVGSVWLPHIGDGLTRPHQTSVVVLVLAAVTLVLLRMRGTVAHQPATRDA